MPQIPGANAALMLDITSVYLDAIVELNAAEVQQTSAMDRERLQHLLRLASFSKVVVCDGQAAAFMIAMREGVPYANDNYGWFAARYSRFLYVDRIVVGAHFGGRGIGSLLYDNAFEWARQHDVTTIACEYNVEPPNPASRAFHDKYGFQEVGSQWVAGGSKRVSLQVAVI
jgi:predicted GNAT superfamily acetyltransferase